MIAVTMGDPAGIGPEIIIKSLAEGALSGAPVVVVGCAQTLRRILALNITPRAELRIIDHPAEASFSPATINVIDEPLSDPQGLRPGEVQAQAGDLAFRCIRRATALALEGAVAAIATAPLNKEALHLAGHAYPGHTELLAHLTQTTDYAMVLYTEKLKVIHITTHISLRQFLDTLNQPRIETVIGVAEEKQSMFGSSKILRVWLPYSTISGRIMGQSWLNSITVRVKEGYDSALAEQQLERLLTLRHGKKDFFTWNMDGLLKTAEKTTRTLQLFLTLVAVISLVVGGIGVMNIMLVSVTERTREIGIRMAVGARASDVLQQFLIEAVLVCLVGGAMGIALSMMIAFALQLFLPGWEIGFSPMAILTAFLCSTFTGILFGWLPARNAARLDPVDALARE